jgi:FixJ family two-component response regulator
MSSLPSLSPSLGYVYLVDDDESALLAYSRLLRLAGYEVETFDQPENLLLANSWRRPGCLIVDLKMPRMNGLELQKALLSRGLVLPILFLSGEKDPPAIVNAMRSGALDYLTKPIKKEDLLTAVGDAIRRDVETERSDNELNELRVRFERLTPREQEVCLLVGRGLQNKEIAAELGTAVKTVKVHRARVMKKMEANSVADLVRVLLRVTPANRQRIV